MRELEGLGIARTGKRSKSGLGHVFLWPSVEEGQERKVRDYSLTEGVLRQCVIVGKGIFSAAPHTWYICMGSCQVLILLGKIFFSNCQITSCSLDVTYHLQYSV